MNSLAYTILMLGLSLIAAGAIWVYRKDQTEQRTPDEWAQALGVEYYSVKAWKRENIPLTKRISRQEFERLSRG